LLTKVKPNFDLHQKQKSKAQRKRSHQQRMDIDSARDIHYTKDSDATTNHSTMVEKA
jgi:hypothetical protein